MSSGASGLRKHDHTSAGQGGTISIAAALTVKDEGTPLTTDATSLDYVGAGVTATGSGAAKTITIPGQTFASPAVALGSSAAAGTAGTGIRSDSTIAAFDATAPTTQAVGDSAAVGTAAFAARRDHKHALTNPPLNTLTAPTGDVSMNSHKITNLTDPASAQDAATKAYADGLTGAAIAAKDEGSTLTATMASIDFAGAGVTATNVGTAVTVTIPGGGGSALASGRVLRTAGDISTASTTFIDATSMTVTLTTGARPCLVSVIAVAAQAGGGVVGLDINIDGTREGGTFGLNWASVGAGDNLPLSFTHVTAALSAASHTIKLQWLVSASTGTLYASGTSPLVLSVVELNA